MGSGMLTGCANGLCPVLLCCKQVFQKPLIVINYPKGIKAFYMKVRGPYLLRICTTVY
jgi:hypothetical protein